MNRFSSHHVQAMLVAISIAGIAGVSAGQAGPGVIRGASQNRAFPLTPPPVKVSMGQLPGDKPGVYTCCFTVRASKTTWTDLVMGSYDQTKGTFTATNEAAAFNTTSFEVALSLEPRLGRYAVFTRGNQLGPVSYHFAARSRPGIPFPAAVQISGVPKGTINVTLGYVGGVLKLFYSQPGYKAIVMQDLDISNLSVPKLTGTAQVVVRTTVSSHNVLPGTLITGPGGDVEGLVYAQGLSDVDSHLFFQAGLDPTRPGSMVLRSCGPNCGYPDGGVAGGRLLFIAASTTAGFMVHDAELAWVLGDVVRPGQTANIFGAVSNPGTAVTVVLMSTTVKPKVKLPSPFDVGHLGVDLSSSLVLGLLSHNTATQRGQMSFPVPNDARLRGLSAALQGMSFSNGRALAWTNTAWLDVQ